MPKTLDMTRILREQKELLRAGFQDRLVMTASISLRVFSERKYNSIYLSVCQGLFEKNKNIPKIFFSGINLFSYSRVNLIPSYKLINVDFIDLFLCYSEAPISFSGAGCIKSCVSSVKKKVLKWKNEESRVACEHSS